MTFNKAINKPLNYQKFSGFFAISTANKYEFSNLRAYVYRGCSDISQNMANPSVRNPKKATNCDKYSYKPHSAVHKDLCI